MPNHRKPGTRRPADEALDRLVVPHMLVAVGHHRAASIPPAAANNMDLGGEERVGVADHGADVQIVLPVLDRHVEVVPPLVQVRDDRLLSPVAVPVNDIASVTVRQQVWVIVRVVGRGALPRTHPDLKLLTGHGS